MLKSLSIIILVFASYYPAVYGDFIWDDDAFLTHNPVMEKPDALKRFWASTDPPDYFPLVSTSLWVQRQLWDLNPMGYHIFNISLHTLNAILLFYLLFKLRFRGAWITAAIFALHPVHVESVAWITEIKNLQSTFFFMLTLIFYLNFLNSRKKHWYILSLLIFLMALLSKTSVVMLPVVLLLYHWWKEGVNKRENLLNSIPFFLLSAVLSCVTIWFQYNRAGASGGPWAVDFIDRIAIAGKAVWFYTGKLIFPYDLIFIYPRWSIGTGDIIRFLPAAALMAVFFILWNRRDSWGRAYIAGFGFFVINLFPILGFFNIYFMRYSFVADHWQYLASPGIIALVVWKASLISENKFFGKATLKRSLVFLLLGTLAFSTYHRAELFQQSFTIWEDALKKNPDAWMAHNNMGIELEKKGKRKEAIEHYRETVRLNPRYALAHNNLGLALLYEGKIEEAAASFRNAVRENPAFGESYNNLGNVLYKAGKMDEAEKFFKKALEINPGLTEAHNNLANILDIKGRKEEAKRHYEAALRLAPRNAGIYNNLGTFYLSQKEYVKAAQYFKKALQLSPDLKEARQNLLIAQEQIAGRGLNQ